MPDVEKMADSIFAAVETYLAKRMTSVESRFTDLEQRIAAIPAGKDGKDGLHGKDGLNGTDGKDGARGSEGQRGTDGIDGAVGSDGSNGMDGKDGLNGKDGAAGMTGKDGLRGERGEKGADGVNGKDFDPAELYASVARAVADIPKPKDGRDGKDARDGRPGKDGEPGRDALDLDILPAIDEAKSYPRGTHASHAGGLIKAYRNTDPIVDGDVVEAGWQVLSEGLRSMSFQTVDEGRTFVFSALLTSGKSFVQEMPTPFVIDRGVFRSGEDYSKGDGSTWDGSFWIAQKDTQDKPGTSDAWRLAVKRGRDGKDGQMKSPPAPPVISLGKH